MIGTFGQIHVQRIASGRYRASTRYRDVDGRLRRVAATGSNAKATTALLRAGLSTGAVTEAGSALVG